MTKVNFEIDTTPPPHGLIFDGDNRGRYTGEAVQNLALSYGYTGERLEADAEFYDEAITEAEDWLNANIAKEGTSVLFSPPIDISPVLHFVNS